ncbi:CRTAC1 family protein [Cellulophaga sp. E16_2]|uniref:ASPIC/UnbV domain protein n=1 Tax=Cellulophaga algicola (strain DSM 14237 / IC166 / ACAM 630) TaxID=688270 RepID=E6XAT4_CELAD|nr:MULTISPECIES: VCBS repeat-containing protein [Cellulophaga]ADV47775.1 hypothetical protein Celal_0433 [Cellulophaga algicola DSM 14237]MBO0590156.1 CRTAC1 family protein [Cellulophaga sp. E16_2]
MTSSKTVLLSFFLFVNVLTFFCTKEINAQEYDHKVVFSEVFKDFPKEEKNLRKWGAPVVADLDCDGFLDILLNDHGFSVKVLWNNKGTFEKPYDLIMGDMHGIAVGDFDFDGNLEVIIARGGGSGSNARNSKIFRVDASRTFTAVPDFDVPLKLMRGRTVKFIDADNDGDLDLLNFAFPDAKKNGVSENYSYQNNENHQLVEAATLPAIKADGQKTLVTDFNNDAIKDIILYGNGNIIVYQGNGDLTFTDVTSKVLSNDMDEVTDIAEIDFDNDGDFDLYLTRGKDFEVGETFYDTTTKVWGFYTKRGEFKFDPLEVGDVLNIENLQSQWPQKTLYIGESGYEYKFPGETHSGRDIRLVNSDALGFPDTYENKGTYIGYIGNREWMLAGSIWSPSTGIIHGVEHYKQYEHPKGPNDILLENKNGKFYDVTKNKNLYFEEHNNGITIADLDNNGYQDIVIIPRGDLIHGIKAIIYLNQGEKGFKKLEHHTVLAPELGAIGMSVEAFDYNNDGMVDLLMGNDRGKWHLFQNNFDTNTENQFLVLDIKNAPSGKATALGASVSIKNCKSQQNKIIGATSDAYSQSFNNLVHFGLGKCKSPVAIKVTYTNGEIIEEKVPNLNTTLSLGLKK